MVAELSNKSEEMKNMATISKSEEEKGNNMQQHPSLKNYVMAKKGTDPIKNKPSGQLILALAMIKRNFENIPHTRVEIWHLPSTSVPNLILPVPQRIMLSRFKVLSVSWSCEAFPGKEKFQLYTNNYFKLHN